MLTSANGCSVPTGISAAAALRACTLGRERTLLAVLARHSPGRLGAPTEHLERCLYSAVEWGRCTPEMAKALIRRGADVNAPGLPFLHRACAACEIGTVRVLLGAGARIGAMDDYGEMPHEVAGRLRRNDVVRLFKKG